MIYKLDIPITVGDFENQIVVDQLELRSMSMVLDGANPVLSIVLIHVVSGWSHNIVYRDATAMDFWNSLESGSATSRSAPTGGAAAPAPSAVSSQIFAKLMADKKLPSGSVA